MMPMVGISLSKGVKPKYLIPFGLLIFGLFTFWVSKILTAQTGAEDFFWPLILRGIGLGLLFVPLTTQLLTGLQGREIGQAAGLSGMIRQLGGSFGVAICSTLIAKFTYLHRFNEIQHISTYDAPTQERVGLLTNAFMSKGFSLNVATSQAYAALERAATMQATVNTYIDIFLYLGVFFVICIPLVFFVRDIKAAGKVDISSAH
jgi:DHA2 family multidrug resistance protein